MSLTPPPGTLGSSKSQPKQASSSSVTKGELTPPKCFGTDYFGKWNQTGMTFESMKIDRPEYQFKCANCDLFERCYMANHIRLMRIKR
jgi:hypothetical protein